jgi:hypothetical protein
MNTLYGILSIIFLGGIPAALIILGFSLSQDSREEAKFWIESGALYLSLLALYFAERAARKSKETENQLIRYGLSDAENKTEFGAIFKEHLVDQLGQFKNRGAKIYLLLSTPAYGYAVVGSGKFGDFALALEELNAECTLELIFFSPDDHFPYWANVLLWSEISSRDGEQFAEGFANGINRVFAALKTHNNKQYPWKLWVTQATTVREFAFFPSVQDRDDNPDNPADRIYLVLTDPFSISQEQFKASFQARSIRIASFGGKEFAGEPESYFERIKVCPYTGRSRETAALIPSAHGRELETLMTDYILGRTHRRILELESFKSEIKIFLASETVKKILAEGTTKDQLLLNILRQILRYYKHVLDGALIGAQLSKGHGGRIIGALRNCKPTTTADEAFKKDQTELLAKIGTINAELKAMIDSPSNNLDATPAPQQSTAQPARTPETPANGESELINW